MKSIKRGLVSLAAVLMLIFTSITATADAEIKAGEYSVPYKILNAYNKSESMADESRNGDMLVRINEDGTSEYYMSVKARVQDNLIGHITSMWNIASNELPTGAPSDYEKEDEKAQITETVTEKGLDGAEHEYASVLYFKRAASGEEYFYVRIAVDAMGNANQNAKIELDWSKAKETSIALGEKSGEEKAYKVRIDLWNSYSEQASMGNAALANNTEGLLKGNTLYIATNPVDVSGYVSALIAIQYDKTGKGEFEAVNILQTAKVNTGTKFDKTDHELSYIALCSIELPEYIKKEGVEYIPLKMQVPYTPMDFATAATGGYLDARLRIDWTSKAESEQTELSVNTQSGGNAQDKSESEAANVKSSFKDMQGHWASEYVEKAVGKGLFKGVSDTEFAPEALMTNGMVITVLYRIAGEPQTDAASDKWYAKAVAWGEKNKIIGDYGVLPFNPERNVTREEFATMLYRYHCLTSDFNYLGYLDSFADKGQISAWANEAFEWAYGNGIISGKGESTLAPKDNATRAEIATMLMRYMK